jgi:hypothetical protein
LTHSHDFSCSSSAGDDVYIVPEESQKDTPPSYASAQADAVPPYWETTVHAPSSPDDMIIDHLPTGSVFSFLWNLLISISFQFVGFLLTYLLHTTHAARFGSRAGLGVTLIQYGFALRTRSEEDMANGWLTVGGGPYGNGAQEDATPPKQTFSTKEEAEEYYRKLNITMVNGMPSGTIPGATMDDLSNVSNEATTDWLSFFLMTIGAIFIYFWSYPMVAGTHSFTLTFFPRLVHPPHIAAQLLARQALGTQHPRLATGNNSCRSRRRRPVTRVFHASAPLRRHARARHERASPRGTRPLSPLPRGLGGRR